LVNATRNERRPPNAGGLRTYRCWEYLAIGDRLVLPIRGLLGRSAFLVPRLTGRTPCRRPDLPVCSGAGVDRFLLSASGPSRCARAAGVASGCPDEPIDERGVEDMAKKKSTRLNSSHVSIS